MRTISYTITKSEGGYTVTINDKKRNVTAQEFSTRIACLNYVNSYCISNKVTTQ